MNASLSPAIMVPDAARSRWAWHIAALGVFTLSVLALFSSDVLSAVRAWLVSPTYSHCFLIIPISAWLVWSRRSELAIHSPELAPVALLALPVLALLWLTANFVTINEVRQFAIVAMVETAIIAFFGWRIFRTISFPVLYLFFLVPFGQYLIPPMQEFATWFTDIGLTWLNVPHYTEGTFIQLPNGTFEIAEACAGLRFLIATVALGILFTHLAYRGWKKSLSFLAACIIVPLIANGFRCIGIILLAYLTNNKVATGADHLIYGWVFNTAILLVLLIAGWRFRDSEVEPRPVRPNANPRPFSPSLVISLTLAAILLAGSGPAFATWLDERPLTIDPSSVTGRFAVQGWTKAIDRPWHPVFDSADLQLMATITPSNTESAAPVDVAVMFYARNRQGHSVLAGTNYLWDINVWHGVGSSSLQVNTAAAPIALNEDEISSATAERLVWWTYSIGGELTRSPLKVKLLQLKGVITGNEAAAVIALSVPVVDTMEKARAELSAAWETAMKQRPALAETLH